MVGMDSIALFIQLKFVLRSNSQLPHSLYLQSTLSIFTQYENYVQHKTIKICLYIATMSQTSQKL